MNIALWAITALAAAAFFFFATMKLRPAPTSTGDDTGEAVQAAQSSEPRWLTPTTVKIMGIAEILGALGLILPGLTGIAEPLVIVAALCLGVIMIGAIVLETRAGRTIMPAVILGVLVFAIAIGRIVFGF